jgi:hypothetical protein
MADERRIADSRMTLIPFLTFHSALAAISGARG